MHHSAVILQECAAPAFTSRAVKQGDLDNEAILADFFLQSTESM